MTHIHTVSVCANVYEDTLKENGLEQCDIVLIMENAVAIAVYYTITSHTLYVYTLQCPPCAILSFHVRQPAHSSANAQTCHCHHWLALWLSVTRWIEAIGLKPLNRALSQKKHLTYRDHTHPQQPTVLGEWKWAHCPSLFSIMNEWCPPVCTVYRHLSLKSALGFQEVRAWNVEQKIVRP